MATLVNHLGHYMPQVTQHQMLGATNSYAASQIASQNLLPRLPSVSEAGYGGNPAYPQTTSIYPGGLKSDSLKAPPPLGQHYYVDHMMNPHPYSSLYQGLDLNAIRRKNATRETTGPLKNWLKAHKKNPYPTKGEKVMLAIATRMTLTQVSTWFANARRRMKKDKVDDDNDDDHGSLPDTTLPEKRERSGSLSSSISHYSVSEGDTSKDLSDISDVDVDDSIVKKRHTKKCVQRLFSPDPRPDPLLDPSSSPDSIISGRLSVTDSGDSRLPSLSEVMPGFMIETRNPVSTFTNFGLSDNSSTVTNHGLSDNRSTVTNHGLSDTSATVTNSDRSDNRLHSQKPKIWSISEIIGSASSTLNTESTHTGPYSYSHVPYSDYFSTNNNYNYPTIDLNTYAAFTQQNYDHVQQSQGSLHYL